MEELQVRDAATLYWAEAETSRSLYVNEHGDLCQNPIHVARSAERSAFDGILGGRSEQPVPGAALTLNPIEAGLRVLETTRLLEARDLDAEEEKKILGETQALAVANQAMERRTREMRVEVAMAARRPLSLERRTEAVTAAVGTIQGRRELLEGIRESVQAKLASAGIEVVTRAWEPSRSVRTLAAHPYFVTLFEPSSINPWCSPAESASAVLAARIKHQMRDAAPLEVPAYLEVCTIDDYGERTFGWAARVVVDNPLSLPEPGAGPSGTPGQNPTRTAEIPRYRVFAISGPADVCVQVPCNPVLRHKGGSRTIWNGLLMREEAEKLLAEVAKVATIQEVQFEAVPKPTVAAGEEGLVFVLDDADSGVSA